MISKEHHEELLNIERNKRHADMIANLTAIANLKTQVRELKDLIKLEKNRNQQLLRKERKKLEKEQAQHKKTMEKYNAMRKRKFDEAEASVPRVAITRKGQPNKHDVKWKQKFEELQSFRARHGHCNVPQQKNHRTPPDILELSKWVKIQRQEHHNLISGMHAAITRERIQLLNGIGFKWQMVPTKLSWDERFAQLKKYHETFGNVNVPQKNNPDKFPDGLGEYVLWMRRQHKGGRLEQAKIDALESLGFQWSLRTRRNTKETAASTNS